MKILTILFIAVHCAGMQNADAKPLRKKSCESMRLGRWNKILFQLCYGLGDIGVRGMERLRVGLEVQVFVVEHLTACNAGSLGIERTYT